VAEALSDAFGTWQRQKEAAESNGQPLSFEKLIDDYEIARRTEVGQRSATYKSCTELRVHFSFGR
jgi:hypothetical protein